MRVAGLVLSLSVLVIAGSATAQHQPQHHHRAHPPTASATPYAGLQTREIKALSDQDIADLRAGRGMGLALAAELNSYPGPMHVLELADQLRLSAEQRTQTSAAFSAMQRETAVIGEQVIAGERALDQLFQARTVTPENLDSTVMQLEQARGRLRAAHLRTHLRMVAILSPEQIAAYDRLRGYSPR
jgi:Heavy-metal resistance